MRDPYTVLGLAKSASAADVKRAYRKLAKANHPDTVGGDAGAKERFAEIGAAYEILGDKEKRAQFDRGEIDAEGKPRFQGFEGVDPRTFAEAFGQGFGQSGGRGGSRTFRFSTNRGGAQFDEGSFGGADDILRSLFGEARGGGAGPRARSAATRGADVSADAAVTLEDIAAARKVQVSLPTGKTVALTLPKGVHDGQTIRLKGQGRPGSGGAGAGDALVTVRFVPHPHFRAEGADLRLDVPVSLDEAVLGAKIAVPTMAGKVQITVPPNSSSGKILRLKGKGLPGKSGPGDLLVRLAIALPDSPDDDLTALMKAWRTQDRKSPRGAGSG